MRYIISCQDAYWFWYHAGASARARFRAADISNLEDVAHTAHQLEGFDLSKLEHRKMLIEVFLNSVYVFNDKIVISCNYKDGTKTVNFSEMESALTLRASVSGSDLDCPGAPKKFRK